MVPTFAFFDSGIGGLALLKHCSAQISAHYIYYADNAYMPYGNKSKEFIQDRTLKALNILCTYNPSVIVVACFSASSYLTATDKNRYPTLISMFDLFNATSQRLSNYNNIGIIATQATIERGYLKNHLSKLYTQCSFIQQACPLLALAIEYQEPEDRLIMLIKEYLHPLLEQSIDALLLGCTHYEIISTLIAQYIGSKISIISSKDLLIDIMSKFSQNSSSEHTLTMLSSQELSPSYERLLTEINTTVIQKKVI